MTTLVVGNWKMNGSRALLAEFGETFKSIDKSIVEVFICPPFPLVNSAHMYRERFGVGAQDCSIHEVGAFTG